MQPFCLLYKNIKRHKKVCDELCILSCLFPQMFESAAEAEQHRQEIANLEEVQGYSVPVPCGTAPVNDSSALKTQFLPSSLAVPSF